MADKYLPPIDTLRKLLAYDPETGTLTWKARTPDLCRPTRLFSATEVCKAWNSKYAGKLAFPIASNGYAQGSVFGHSQKGHRVAWALYYGRLPNGFIDHINGNPSDNRIVNLREVDCCANSRNARIPNIGRSGILGVTWNQDRQTWDAYISIRPRKRKRIGRFKTKEAAAAARKAAEKEYGYHPNHRSKS